MVVKTISHFEILKKTSSGGIGEVYLAEDKLDRKVALEESEDIELDRKVA